MEETRNSVTLLVSGLKTKRINRKTYSSRIMWARRGILCVPVCGKRENSHARELPVDGYEPKSNTIFQYHGCKWHGCPCQKRKERNSLEEERSADQRYAKTIELKKKMKEQGFKIISVWECEKPELKKKRFCKKFRPYPYFIVYDFEAICQKINEKQTDELEITAKHIPVSVAINDNLTKKPSFIVEEDPKKLIKNS